MTEEETTPVETPTEDDTPSVDLWINPSDVITTYGFKPKQFNLEKTDDNGLTEMVTTWIIQGQSLIENYVHRPYTSSTVSPAVQNVLGRIVSNMATFVVQRRDTPIIKVNDWNIQTVPSKIFSDDEKEDLKPFIKDSSNDYGKIGFFAITGADESDSDGSSNS